MSMLNCLGTPPPPSRGKRSRVGPSSVVSTPPVISQSDDQKMVPRFQQGKKFSAVPTISALAGGVQRPPLAPFLTGKQFNCGVHGMIHFDELCIKIIDSPSFQRLHNLKQLGTSDFVFRGATHTRFEHSIGVAYLAEKMASTLKKNQPDLDITEEDVRCVKIAGLCHDLGHGPFSHVFDGVFIKKCRPDTRWRHEDGSVNMLRYILRSKGIKVTDYGLTDSDLTFIEEIVAGTPEQQRKGRASNKFFLYDIVNNNRSGLDVDKIDYFERDMKASGVAGSITPKGDFSRFVELGVVLPAEPLGLQVVPDSIDDFPLMICYPEKLIDEAVALFGARFQMHQRVYTHQVVKQIEFMITDALLKADPFISIPGTKTLARPDGLYKMSECIDDMEAFSRLTDSIVDVIALTPIPIDRPATDLIKAKEIIDRIRNRDLYTCVGQTSFHKGGTIFLMTEQEIEEEILSYDVGNDEECNAFDMSDEDLPPRKMPKLSSCASVLSLQPNDIIVEKMHIHHGQKDKNPVDLLRFYPKRIQSAGNTIVARKIDEGKYSTLLPRSFEHRAVRVFCRNPEKSESVRKAFNSWCLRMGAHSPFPSASFPTEDDLEI